MQTYHEPYCSAFELGQRVSFALLRRVRKQPNACKLLTEVDSIYRSSGETDSIHEAFVK